MQSSILFYQTSYSNINVEVTFLNENFWLTQKAIAQLYNVDRTVVTKHLKNIFDTNELIENSVCAKIAHTAKDGKSYKTNFYNLEAIIAVGYRVNSSQATQFRIWATKTLKEFIIKGFVLNDEMLKNGKAFGKDYFEELLEKIRDPSLISANWRSKFVLPKDDFIKKSLIFMLYRLTMIKMILQQELFLQLFKTSCIGQFQEKLLLK